MEDFKVGDIVKLKSGGPKMTVSNTDKGIDDKNVIECIWFQKENKFSDEFPNDALVKTVNTHVGFVSTPSMYR